MGRRSLLLALVAAINYVYAVKTIPGAYLIELQDGVVRVSLGNTRWVSR